MKNGKLVLLTGAVAAFSGAMLIAQTGGGMKAHAEIKGEGITGRAELVERRQGTGTVVEITVTAHDKRLERKVDPDVGANVLQLD